MECRVWYAAVLTAICSWIVDAQVAAQPQEEPTSPCVSENVRLRARIAELEAQLAAAPQRLRQVASAPPVQMPSSSSTPESPLQRAESEVVGILLTPRVMTNVVMSFVCVSLAALAAGLTMGLLSLEEKGMDIIVKTEEKDVSSLEEKIKLKEDQDAAQKVLPLIKDHHRLLVTLLLLNSMANEALPLFLDQLVPSFMAVILSVTLVLMFGEIIPSAIFTGSEQLRIASRFTPLVSFLVIILTPIALPIARMLDFVLGADHKGRYNFAELKAIVKVHADLLRADAALGVAVFKSHDAMGVITTEEDHNFTADTCVIFTHSEEQEAESTKLSAHDFVYFVKPCPTHDSRDTSRSFQLFREKERRPDDLITFEDGELISGAFKVQERDELKIMSGVMHLTQMTASERTKPLSQVKMYERQTVLSLEKLKEILETGYSRLPIYEGHKHNVRGFVLVKKLIVVSPEDNESLENMVLEKLVVAHHSIPMLDLLNKFQAYKCHIGLITNNPDRVQEAWDSGEEIPPDVHMMGIVTLENVIETLLQEAIDDEHDALKRERSFMHYIPHNGGTCSSPNLLGPCPSATSQASNMLTRPLLSEQTM